MQFETISPYAPHKDVTVAADTPSLYLKADYNADNFFENPACRITNYRSYIKVYFDTLHCCLRKAVQLDSAGCFLKFQIKIESWTWPQGRLGAGFCPDSGVPADSQFYGLRIQPWGFDSAAVCLAAGGALSPARKIVRAALEGKWLSFQLWFQSGRITVLANDILPEDISLDQENGAKLRYLIFTGAKNNLVFNIGEIALYTFSE